MSKQAEGQSGEAREGAVWTRAGDEKLTHSCWWSEQRKVVLRSEIRGRRVGNQEKWAQWVFPQRGSDHMVVCWKNKGKKQEVMKGKEKVV